MCFDLCQRQAKRHCRQIEKRHFVKLRKIHLTLSQAKTKRVAHGQDFSHRHMFGPGHAAFKQVCDPAGPIDEQGGDHWLASRFFQLTGNVP